MAVLSDECELVSVSDPGDVLGCKEAAPLGESGGAVGLEILSAIEGALLIEMVMDRGVNGGELLQCSHPTKAEHRALSPSEGLVRILRAIVGPTTGLLAVADAKLF